MRCWILLALVGCWRGGSDTTPEPPAAVDSAPPVQREAGAPCDEVATNVRTLIEDGNDEQLRARAAQIGEVVLRRCSEDGWSMELRRCLAGAKVLDDTDGCEKLATKDQEEKLEHDIELEENAN